MKKILSLCFICLFSYVGGLSAEVRFAADPGKSAHSLVKPGKCPDGKVLYDGVCVVKCNKDMYPFMVKPDERRGTTEVCKGMPVRYRYVSCNDGWAWNKDKTDCVSTECTDYMFDTQEIAGCEKVESCNAQNATFYKCVKCKDGFKLDAILGRCMQDCDLGEYTLDVCPEGGVCSDKTCGDVIKYKLDGCLNDYKLENGACVCNKMSVLYAETNGEYKCSCPYPHDEDEGGMCFLEVGMKNMCGVSGCDYEQYFVFNEFMANYLKINNIDDLRVKIRTYNAAGEYIGLLGGSNNLYFKHRDCEDLGKKYFSQAGVHVEYAERPDPNGCVADCSAFTLDRCPANGVCSVCGGKYKLDGCEKGFGVKDGVCKASDNTYECYKFDSDWSFKPVESAECDCANYDAAVGGMLSPVDNAGCSASAYYCKKVADSSLWVSKDCGSCSQGYEMNASGKCEFIPCGAEYWMATNDGGNGFLSDIKMSGCKSYDTCLKHYGKNAYIGNQKWLDTEAWGYFSGDKRDGCAPATNSQEYLTCLECEAGYHMVNNACVADSGVGSVYEYKGTPIGIIFYEDNEVIKLVSLENLGKPEIAYYTMSGGSDGHNYNWDQAMEAAEKYAPSVCERNSFCGKGKWHLPTVEEMSAVVDNYVNGGPIMQAIRGLDKSCSNENLMGLFNRYWTSTETIIHVTDSAHGAYDAEGAYLFIFPNFPMKEEKEMWRNGRPVLVIQK